MKEWKIEDLAGKVSEGVGLAPAVTLRDEMVIVCFTLADVQIPYLLIRRKCDNQDDCGDGWQHGAGQARAWREVVSL